MRTLSSGVARDHRDLFEPLGQLLVAQAGQIGAGDHPLVLGETSGSRDHGGSSGMVAGDHDDADTCPATARNRIGDGGSQGVAQPEEADETQIGRILQPYRPIGLGDE
jgi:hypothetical protein